MSKESLDAKLRVVIDTSVYIAALLRPDGLSGDVLRLIYQGRGELYCSDDILAELTGKLSGRPFSIDSEKVELAIDNIKEKANFVNTEPVKEPRLRDENDLYIIKCAVAAEAHLIITLDKDLLSLKESCGIGIIHPSSFRYIVTEK